MKSAFEMFHLIGVKHLWTCKVEQREKTGVGGERVEAGAHHQ